MAAPMPASLSSALAAMDKALDAAETAVAPFLSASLRAAGDKLKPLENARLQTALTLVATSLAYGAYRIVSCLKNVRGPFHALLALCRC